MLNTKNYNGGVSRREFMKKILLVLCVLLISTAAFADVILQMDYEGVGCSSYKLGGNCNPQITEREYSEFAPFSGFTLSSVLYEFNSEEDTPIHIYTGLDAGFCGMGASALAVGGCSLTLNQFGNCKLDLNSDVKLGGCFGVTNAFYPMAQIDSVFTILKADRKGPFAGVGFTAQFIDLTFPSLLKQDYYTDSYAGLVFTAGYRF